MLLFATPSALHQRGELYAQLAATESAGISILEAIEMQRRRPLSPAFVEPLTRLRDRLRAGDTLAGGLTALGPWMPPFDRALIEAGEASGRLDLTFRLLGSHYRQRARVARQAISMAMYPLLVVHVAILVFPVSLLADLVWQGAFGPFLAQKATILGSLYGALFAIAWSLQGNRGERWRERVESLLSHVPLLGSARRALALSRLSAALEALLTAGVPIREAWSIAADASGSVALKREVAGWRAALVSGTPPSELLAKSPRFPDMFAGFYRSGEVSGKLDETLGRLHSHFEEEGARKLADFARWAPTLAYGLVVVAVAFQIISFYRGIFTAPAGF